MKFTKINLLVGVGTVAGKENQTVSKMSDLARPKYSTPLSKLEVNGATYWEVNASSLTRIELCVRSTNKHFSPLLALVAKRAKREAGARYLFIRLECSFFRFLT